MSQSAIDGFTQAVTHGEGELVVPNPEPLSSKCLRKWTGNRVLIFARMRNENVPLFPPLPLTMCRSRCGNLWSSLNYRRLGFSDGNTEAFDNPRMRTHLVL